MLKRFLILLCVLCALCGETILAQTTQVTGQVKDANGIPYAGAQMKAQLVFAGTPVSNPTVQISSLGQCKANGFGSAPCQVPFAPTNGPFNLDGSGNIPGGGITLQDNSLVTPAGTQWAFTVSTNGALPPFGTGPQQCSATLSVTGGSQDLSASFNACPALTRNIPSGASGTAGQTQVNNPGVPGALAGTPCQVVGSLATGPINVACDWHPKGPNPYVDITAFGARAVNPNIQPAVPGVTASCNGTNTITVSTFSSFQNGDGVVVYNCGAAHAMTAPGTVTVTPSVALAGTDTLLNTPGPTGATTYNYMVIARDRNGGLSAASTLASTTTGAASLGNQTINITSMSRSGTVVTVTTAANHGFLVGCQGRLGTCGEVFIGGGNGLTDVTFRGWYTVNSAADATHFTFVSGLDTAQGASLSATGGTATFYNENKVTWTTSGSAAVQYGVYSDRAVAGTCALIGVSRPLSSVGTQDLVFEDYGSPMEDNQVFNNIWPASFPCASPPAATNDSLITTITAGAGTTTFTLANSASNTASGQTILFDDGPAILAAANAQTNNYGTVVIPADNTGNVFVINSWTVLPGTVAYMQEGPLYLNDTLEISAPGGGGVQWLSNVFPQRGANTPAAGFFNAPNTSVNRAHPGMFFSGFQHHLHFGTVQFNGIPTNGTLCMLVEGGFQQVFDGVNFISGIGAGDYLSSGIEFRLNPGQANSNVFMNYAGFSPGGGGDAASHTPTAYFRGTGSVVIPQSQSVHRGVLTTGSGLLMGVGGVAYINGGGTPLVTVAGNFTGLVLGPTVMDTIAMPCVAHLVTGTFLQSSDLSQSGCSPSSSVVPVTGGMTGSGGVVLLPNTIGIPGSYAQLYRYNSAAKLFGFAFDNLVVSAGGNYPLTVNEGAFAVGGQYPAFVDLANTIVPTCSVSAGGSVALGTYFFEIAPIWQNGAIGNRSLPSATCTTTTGNQTITINWSALPGNPKDARLYTTSGTTINEFINTGSLTGQTSFVWTNQALSGGTVPNEPAGGPTMLMPGDQGFSADRYTINGNCSSSAAPAACGTSASGSVVVAAAATTVTVNTTAVTANSQIQLTFDSSLGTKLGVTCNTTPVQPTVSARTAGTSFAITVPSAPVTNPACFSYTIMN